MGPTALPARITIDFRDSIDPHRGWILGVSEKPSRIELLAFDEPPTTTADVAAAAAVANDAHPSQAPLPAQPPTALDGDCTCPEFCERDHANE